MKCLACPTEIPEGNRYCSETCAGIADLTLRSVQEIRKVPDREPEFYRPEVPFFETAKRIASQGAVQTLAASLCEAILATDGLDRSECIKRTARAIQEHMNHV